MKSIFKQIFLTATLTLLLSVAYPQSAQLNYFIPKAFPRSPTTSAIEKYGTYQVNEFTGIPNISIPLYTVESGKLKVPIVLSYHASGNKVTDVASWVGLGWSVIAGGQVTRKILGLGDDVAYGYLSGFMHQPGTWNTSNNSDLHWLENVANGTYDTKPDIFSYSFPDHDGKFFFDGSVNGNYTPRLMPYAPIKVTHNTSIPLTQFGILDEHGNNYSFETTEKTNTLSGGQSLPSIITAWKLSNMVSQDKHDTIGITYNSQNVVYPSSDTEIFTVVDQISQVNSNEGNNYSPSLPSNPTTPGNYCVVNEQVPAQINFKNGKVVFDLDPSARLDANQGSGSGILGLADIKIYGFNSNTKAYELQKTIMFIKSYFSTNTTPRLRLDAIQILDKNGSIIQKYQFDYNSLELPDYNSFKQDYWGYYNGKANNMLTPQQSITYNPTNNYYPPNYVTIGSSVVNGRDCDSTFMQADMLTAIHYPTGGYSTFTYQTNQYTELGQLHLAGGLRVKTISSYDGINPSPTVHTYQYNSARKNYFLDYCYFSTSQAHRFYDIPRGISKPRKVAECQVRTFVNSPHCDLEAYDGATVVYPSVTEYIGTPTTNNGKTDYTFTDETDALQNASLAGSLVYLSSFYVRGRLLSKNDYKRNQDGSYQMLKSETHTYTAFPKTDYQSVGLAVKKIYYNDGAAANPLEHDTADPDDTYSFIASYYYITSDDNYLTGTTTSMYDQNDPSKVTTSSISYNYDNIAHQQVSRTYSTDSKGNTKVTAVKYPADYSSSGSTGNQLFDAMLSNNMQAEAIEKWDTVKNIVNNTTGVVSAQLNLYKNGAIAGTIVPDQVEALNTSLPVTDFQPATFYYGVPQPDGRYEQVNGYNSYDSQNNLVQYKARNATPVSLVWGYNGQYPIAEVKNATYQDVINVIGQSVINQLNSNPQTDDQVRNALAPIRSALPNAQVTIYTYSPLVGITSMTDPKGMTTTYEYDSFQRLLNVKDKDGNIVKRNGYHYQNQ